MSGIRIAGWGAVSPAGWSVAALRDAVAKGELLEPLRLERSSGGGIDVLRVPPPVPKPPFLSHARLRRASSITQFTVAAALEALGPNPAVPCTLGVIVCVFSGCVSYSRRFYGETLRDPSTASPLVFPETVFNAPASHLSAYLGSTGINYTLVGDVGTYLVGLATAAQWITEGRLERCLVVGTEELDWLTADALRLFDKKQIASEGAGALLLERSSGPGVDLVSVTDEYLFGRKPREESLRQMRRELEPAASSAILCDNLLDASGLHGAEAEVWRDWPGLRLSPRTVLGEGLMAGAAWQCVLAADALKNGAGSEALISVAGFHQHAVGAKFALRV